MSDAPRYEETPGIVWRQHKYGWEALWRARTDLVKRGFKPKSARLWAASENEPLPSPAALYLLQDQCNKLQLEMLAWGRGGLVTSAVYNGSIGSLARCYQEDKDSPYHKTRYNTRGYYDTLIRRITLHHGDEAVEDIKARLLLRWHEEWVKDGRIAMAHSLVGMLRTLINFGATILEDAECARLSGVLHRMKFQMGKPRTERLTAEQAIAIRAEAHRQGRKSIALAQAFQFDLMLRQKDVVGEWVPIKEHGNSEIIHDGKKWLRGIRWSEIDDNLILRHTTSKRQKDIEVDLRLAPMVMEELALIARKATGALVLHDHTERPWSQHEFRRIWRRIATKAGIPKAVRNMDSRAGAISEATDAGADLEHIRHAATHGDIAMTQRYSRGSVEKVAKVMEQRAEHRNKKRTE